MKIKPATFHHQAALERAIAHLRLVVRDLKAADCPQATDAARRALKSAEGAERHMPRRLQARDPETGEPLRRTDAERESFNQGARDASAGFDEFNLAHVQRVATQMRRRPGTTPYADGYCMRVGELARATRAPDTPGYRDAPRAPEITNGPRKATRAPEVQS